ncbi:hypothetical protein Tco_0800856 [Tanacetum coccineum]|uniref:Uncharacterized protein n=1 Tax=Tanacetum coccineum TaxID=301880 RepID=A0ABQ4ZYK3_9ASTR
MEDEVTHRGRQVPKKVLQAIQHVAGDIDNIQSASVVMYEREFFYADIVNSWPAKSSRDGHLMFTWAFD